ncbi:uncharacterized protein LOC119085480 [Bradysia coprophila]|uniref:uncharacterized protein LOC119085480 n=1 Tax=Bradysia coprophila TaxID=38358 RepID=UPI00187D86EE|nr:uncharacterized protein LOC119085480 [Bradysia coprophila]
MKPKDQLGCDIRDMYMKTSDQSAKKLCCPFCQKLFIKLARHMEVKHYQQPDVQKFMKLPKGSKERRAIQDSLRKIGQDNFNKNAALNKKELIPSRRSNPKHNRKAVDQKTCPYCFGSYAKSGIHFHIKNKCPQKPIEDERTKGERVLPALTSSVERRYRENACPALQAVFDNCHNDDIVRGVRFDWLAIVYGNKLTLKYSKPRHRKMIKNRMRLIGRVLSALKIIEPEVTELARFLVPKYYDRVVEAIRTVARVDEVRNEFVAPATASSAVTAIRQICEMLIVEYIKQDDQENQRTTRDFLTVMNSDMHISINKMVNETQSRMARQRTVILPSSDDVKRLAQYLEAERTACYNELSQSYNFDSWKRLNELVMASIIIFNRRRVGDTENILDEDFARKEMINDDTSAELLSTLPEHSKQIATQYSRMKVLEAAQGNLTVTNEDAVQSGQEHVNKGRKRKSTVCTPPERTSGLQKMCIRGVQDSGKFLEKCFEYREIE